MAESISSHGVQPVVVVHGQVQPGDVGLGGRDLGSNAELASKATCAGGEASF